MADFTNIFIDNNLPKALSKEKQKELFIRYKNGDLEARDLLIEHNLRLVVNEVIRKFSKSSSEAKDLVSIGTLGLIKAVDNFDVDKNILFATFAVRCIDNEILMYFRKNNKYESDVSIDGPIHTDESGNDISLSETLADEDKNIEENYEKEEEYRIIREVVSELTGREKEMIMFHFGFEDGKYHKQKEVAERFGIAQSYASRLIAKTCRKIKERLEIRNKVGVYTPQTTEVQSVKTKSKKQTKPKVQKLDKRRIVKSVYEIFPNASKKDIDNAISLLSEKDKDLLYRRYGYDLEKPKFVILSQEESKKYSTSVLPKLRKLVNRVRKSDGEFQVTRVYYTIYDYFSSYTKDEVDNAINSLSNYEKELLHERYGENLLLPKKKDSMTPRKRKEFYSKVITKLRKRLSNSKKIESGVKVGHKYNTIYDFFFGYKKEDIDIVIDNLTEEDLNILSSKFEGDIKTSTKSISLSRQEYNKFLNVIAKMKRRLKNQTEKEKSSNRKTIYDLLEEYSKEQIDEAIEKLKPEYKELVYRKYGSDLSNPTIHNNLTKKEYATFYNTVIKHIKMIIEGPKVKTYKSVYKTFSEYTKEEVDAVISTLSEKQKSIIRRREESNITEDEASYYLRSIVPKIKRELQNKKTKKQEKPIVEEIKTNYSFSELLKYYTVTEAVIICLKLGLVNQTFYSAKEISEFLNIPELTIIEITKKALKEHKKEIMLLMNEGEMTLKLK